MADDDMVAMSLNSSPELPIPKNAHLVREVLYKDTAQSFGEDTETGVAKVTMLIDEEEEFGIGHEKDHTGIDMGGGGGTVFEPI